ncbi:MAG: glycerophosphodiester phosphodiesterase [Actinomycetota bacterium]|nr:glycerophosphodiester phosphodiesterase [Actinomycetota bacterium]
MAHRGGSTHADLVGTENTLEAFRHAVKLGYHYLETDVHATRDGVLLAFHDAVLDRVTDQVGRLSDLTAVDVSRALIAGRHAVPPVAELFEEFPDVRFNIDIKSEAAIRPLAALIDRFGAHDRVCIGSFSPSRMATFRRLTQGRVATSAVPTEVAAFRLTPTVVVRRLVRPAGHGGPAALQVPHRRGRLNVVTPALVRRAHAGGLHVHVWTVDDPAEMHALLDLGVDGLITDRTDLLRDVLVARGQWRAHL